MQFNGAGSFFSTTQSVWFSSSSFFQATLEKEKIVDHSHVKSKLERLDLLEKEYTRLTSMQSHAEVRPGVLLIVDRKIRTNVILSLLSNVQFW